MMNEWHCDDDERSRWLQRAESGSALGLFGSAPMISRSKRNHCHIRLLRIAGAGRYYGKVQAILSNPAVWRSILEGLINSQQ